MQSCSPPSTTLGTPPGDRVRALRPLDVRAVERIGRTGVALSARAARSSRTIRAFAPDVVHLHEPFAPGLSYLLLAGHPRRPLVGTFHRSGASAWYSLLRPLTAPMARRLAVRCAVSDAARTTAASALGGHYEVLFNGIEIERLRSSDPWPTDRRALFFLGRHEARKGLEVLLEAFDRLLARGGPRCGPSRSRPVLWIAGDGPLTDTPPTPLSRERGPPLARGAHRGREEPPPRRGRPRLRPVPRRRIVRDGAARSHGCTARSSSRATSRDIAMRRVVTRCWWRPVTWKPWSELSTGCSPASWRSRGPLGHRVGRLMAERVARRSTSTAAAADGSSRPRPGPSSGRWTASRSATRPCTCRWWQGPADERPYTAQTMSDRPEPRNRPASGGQRRRRRGRGRGGGGTGSGTSPRAAAGSRGPAGSGGGNSAARPAGSGSSRKSGNSGNSRNSGRSGKSGNSGRKAAAQVEGVATPVAGPAGAVTVLERTAESTDDSLAVQANRRRAVALCVLPWLVLGLLVGLVLVAVGLALVGLCAFVAVSAIGSSLVWRRGPKVLARSVGARACRESEQPRVYNLVDGLCATMGLPVPEIRVVDSPVPNAMSVGHDLRSTALVVTAGLDESLTLVQLEGVLAHELVHVKRHDPMLAAVAVFCRAALERGQGQRRRSEAGAQARRPWPRIRGRSASGHDRALPAGAGLCAGIDDRSPGHLVAVAARKRTNGCAHPVALDRPVGRVGAPRADRGEPGRHPGAGRSPLAPVDPGAVPTIIRLRGSLHPRRRRRRTSCSPRARSPASGGGAPRRSAPPRA